MQNERRRFLEEIANSVTHGVGLVFSLAGLAVLIILALSKEGFLHIVGCGVYGLTLVLVYAASTLYHSIQRPRFKHLFRQIDQIAIYLVIAGTYTPFTLINLRGFWGWTLLVLVWGISLFAIAFKILFVDRFKAISMALYLVTGWMAIIAVKPIITTIPGGGLALIAGGAFAYMAGLAFYAWDRLPFNHTIWHLFVILGSFCHYCAVLLYVLPAS
jgi:hemolysin III